MLTRVARCASRNYGSNTSNRPAMPAIRRIAPWLALLFIVADCGNAGFDKVGGSHRTPMVLTMANGNFAPQELQAFAAEVARRSGGALRIKFETNWRQGQRDAETGLIRDVRAGKADIGALEGRASDAV